MTNSLKKNSLKKILLDKALVLVLLLMITVIIIIEPTFLQWRVFKDIFTQSSVKLIAGTSVPPAAGRHGPGRRQTGRSGCGHRSVYDTDDDLCEQILSQSSGSADHCSHSHCTCGGCADRLYERLYGCPSPYGAVHCNLWYVHYRLRNQLPIFRAGAEPFSADRRNQGKSDDAQQHEAFRYQPARLYCDLCGGNRLVCPEPYGLRQASVCSRW